MYTVHIKNNVTGEVRQHIVKNQDWDDDVSDYIWSEGNYSCDCNRAIFFSKGTEDEAASWDQECGDTRFSIPFVELEDGTKVVIDR